jgi:hypothetical protein
MDMHAHARSHLVDIDPCGERTPDVSVVQNCEDVDQQAASPEGTLHDDCPCVESAACVLMTH